MGAEFSGRIELRLFTLHRTHGFKKPRMVECTYTFWEAEIGGCLELSGQPAYLLSSRPVANLNRVPMTAIQTHMRMRLHTNKESHTQTEKKKERETERK